MSADLIVYAIVAAGLIFWLRSILGTTDEEDMQKPKPYTPGEKPGDNGLQVEKITLSAQEKIEYLAKHPSGNTRVDNKTAENALIELSKIDESFDIDHFFQGAQDAFTMIVEAFADKDRQTLKDLLEENVYKIFDQSLKEQEKAGEHVEAEIISIRKAEILQARIEEDMSFITIRFTADESRVIRNADGDIIAGDPKSTSKMRDVWTFGKEIKSDHPAWLVYETRSDEEDDNEHIPNSH